MTRFSEQQNQFMVYESIRKGSPPNWVTVLNKTSFPNMSFISKSAKSVLPAQDGGKWSAYLTTDDLTNNFIENIKSGNYSNKGIDDTILILNHWKSNLEDGWKSMKEIKSLYAGVDGGTGITSPKKIRVRVKLMVDEVLPILESKRKGQKVDSGSAIRQNESLSEEFLTKLLDGLTESNQDNILNFLNDRFASNAAKSTYTEFLTSKYGKTVRPILRKLGLDKFRRISITTDSDLSKLGFKPRRGGWVLKRMLDTDLPELKEKLKDMNLNARIKVTPIPVVQIFGSVKEGEEEVLSTIKYKLIEPFTPDKAKFLLEKMRSNPKVFPVNFMPKKLRDIKKQDKFIDYTLIELLDEKFTASIEQGTMADDFINTLQTMKFANEKYTLQYYSKKVWEVSTDEIGKFDENSPYYLGALMDPKYWKVEGRTPPTWKEWRPKIIQALKTGELKDEYRDVKSKSTRALKYLPQSISISDSELLADLLSDDDLTEDEDGDIITLINQIQDSKLWDDKRNKFSGGDKNIKVISAAGKNVDVFFIGVKSTYEKVQQLLTVSKSANNEDIQDLVEQLESEFKEQTDNFNVALSEQGDKFEVEFNDSAFSNEFDRDIAEITYIALTKGESLSEVLGGEYQKNNRSSLSNYMNVIISAESIYATEGTKLLDLAEEITPPESGDLDLNSDPPPFRDKIQEFANTFRSSVVKIREAIIEDLKVKIEDLVNNPASYIDKRKRKGSKSGSMHNVYSILKGKIIEEA